MVIDDGIRDIVDLAAPPAIAARGITSRGTVKRRILAIDEPIGLAGVLVRPRDWVVGDANGVCVVSADSLDGVLVRARTRLDKEAGLLTQLRTGTTTVEALGLWQTRERRPG
jgi:4-hydroxy-4-methyl-2-oxoglutarate aldolase